MKRFSKKSDFFACILSLCALVFLPHLVKAQLQDARVAEKKVAILEVVDKQGKIDYGVKLLLRSSLSAAITNTPGYEGYDRVDVSSIMEEQTFQRTGLVSDEQIKQLGEMTGAAYILVAEAAMLTANQLLITAKILDVQTAKMEKMAYVSSDADVRAFERACNELAAKLLGVASVAGSQPKAQPTVAAGEPTQKVPEREVPSKKAKVNPVVTDDCTIRIDSHTEVMCKDLPGVYTWYEAQEACPDGFHLPSFDEMEHICEHCSLRYDDDNLSINLEERAYWTSSTTRRGKPMYITTNDCESEVDDFDDQHSVRCLKN